VNDHSGTVILDVHKQGFGPTCQSGEQASKSKACGAPAEYAMDARAREREGARARGREGARLRGRESARVRGREGARARGREGASGDGARPPRSLAEADFYGGDDLGDDSEGASDEERLRALRASSARPAPAARREPAV